MLFLLSNPRTWFAVVAVARQCLHTTDKPCSTNDYIRFLAEFDRKAGAALSAGCTYTDTVLAFKLLEKYPIEARPTKLNLSFLKEIKSCSLHLCQFVKNEKPLAQNVLNVIFNYLCLYLILTLNL